MSGFSWTPKTDDEIALDQCWPDGEYDAEFMPKLIC